LWVKDVSLIRVSWGGFGGKEGPTKGSKRKGSEKQGQRWGKRGTKQIQSDQEKRNMRGETGKGGEWRSGEESRLKRTTIVEGSNTAVRFTDMLYMYVKMMKGDCDNISFISAKAVESRHRSIKGGLGVHGKLQVGGH